jgi:hypothetical protein
MFARISTHLALKGIKLQGWRERRHEHWRIWQHSPQTDKIYFTNGLSNHRFVKSFSLI